MAKQKDQNPVPAAAFDDVVLGWMSPEYLRFDRGWPWFVMLFGISGLLIWYAYVTGSVTMMVLFSVMPLVLILEHRKKPRTVEVIFSPYGVKFGEMKIPYSNIRSFWILHQLPHVDEVHLMTNRKSHPEVVIQLMGTNPALLRQYLMTQLVEQEGKQISMIDLLVRILRLS